MGLLIHDTITLRNGQKMTDSYASFRYSNMFVSCLSTSSNTSSNSWMVTTTYGLWRSNVACVQGGTPVESRQVQFQMTNDQLNQPFFTALYGVLKNQFQSTTDC
jgi:hypothetical protein